LEAVGELSDVTRRRIAAVLLVVGIVLVALAATDTGPLFDDPPTEEERVAGTVEELFDAAADGDFRDYCELLTPLARNEIRANAARLVEQGDVLSCDEIMKVAGKAFKGVELRVRDVSVSGNRARVEANLKRADQAGLEPRTILLELDGAGDWRVSDPG
jgi:hypothetical protein